MSARPPVVLRPRRELLVLGVGMAGAFVGVGYWVSGVIGWLGVAFGVVLVIYGRYRLVTRQPGLTLTEEGTAWPGRRLRWDEVASLREVSWSQGLARYRFLGIDTVGHARRTRCDPRFFGVDYTITVRALERPPHEISELVETYSGLPVQRLP